MNTFKKPNLFNFATSELSQDAFLCWLVSWLNADDSEPLKQCAQEFLSRIYCKSWVYRMKGGMGYERLTSKLVGAVKKQCEHIDVYFECEIDGENCSFIIEDKTGTGHHDNQLQTYFDKVSKALKKKGQDKKIIMVYLKTGFWFPDDYLAEYLVEGERVVLFEAAELYSVLEQYVEKANNHILIDFAKRLRTLLRGRESIGDTKVLYDSFDRSFEHPGISSAEAQAYYMYSLSRLISSSANPSPVHRVRHGQDRGDGRPWIQLDLFRRIKAKENKAIEVMEGVFYRVGVRARNQSPCPVLVLRHWMPVKKCPDLRSEKLGRLSELKKIFSDIESELNPSFITSKDIRNDYKGANESDIAICFIEDPSVFDDLKEEFLCLHSGFVQRVISKKLFTGECAPDVALEFKLRELEYLQRKK